MNITISMVILAPWRWSSFYQWHTCGGIIECKNTTVDEAIAIGIDQLRRAKETPEMMVPQQMFTVTESLLLPRCYSGNMNQKHIH
ncbi:MAG: hypothetical protein U0586_15950 [Candidatus Brocadiaceae bacterium]